MLRIHVADVAFEPWFSSEALPAALQRAFDFEAPGTAHPRAPGIFSVGDEVGVVLPRCFRGATAADDQVVAAGHTIRVLRRYLDENKSRKAVAESDLEIATTTVGDIQSALDRLEAMLLLWHDYHRNGSIQVAEQQLSVEPRGRIHWPRTMATTAAMVSGLNVLFPHPIRTRHAITPKHPLTELHALTAQAVGHFLGAAHARRVRPVPLAEASSLLDRYERVLFQDRHRFVASLLRRYYRPSHGRISREARPAAGIFSLTFPKVWERMLFVALGSATLPMLPQGRYRFPDDSPAAHGTSFILDLFLEGQHRGEMVQLVLDAKDYALGTFPSGEAVNKQLLYRLLLAEYSPTSEAPRSRVPLERIGNAFVSPAVVHDAAGVHVRAIHDLAGQEQADSPLGRIVSLEIDFARVATAYSHGRADRALRAAVVDAVMGGMRRRLVVSTSSAAV